MNYTVLAYSIYLPVAVALTVWVARTLYQNSNVFLVDIFHGQQELAVAVNKLLQVGFYLVSLGYAVIKLRIEGVREVYTDGVGTIVNGINNTQSTIEELSYKLGGFILILGLMLFFNLFILLLLRGGARNRNAAAAQGARIIA